MNALKLTLALILSGSAAIYAQVAEVTAKPLTEADIQLLRSNIQAQKNQIITHTMQFTDAEASAFWPIYRQYANEQNVIADKRLALIKDYAENYDSMDNAKAARMMPTLFQIDAANQDLRRKYFPSFEKALGAKRAAKFYQVDSRLALIANFQLASAIPLIP
jgi:hypothetical protein